MKLFVQIFLLASAVLCSGMVLTDHGKSSYVIVLPEKTDGMEELAARELQEYLKKATGAELKICRDAKQSPAIILRRDPALQADESRVEISGNDLILSGGDEWGVLYAVYEFLENQLGVRWYSAYGHEKVPVRETLDLSFEAYTKKPAYRMRGGMCYYYYQTPEASKFFLRNRLNTQRRLNIEDMPGSKARYYPRGSAHSFFYYIPVRKGHYPKSLKFKEEKYYFEEHPEYFSMNSKGDRVTNMQLCFSNQELRKEFTRRFLEAVELNGTDGIYPVSSMDWPGKYCYCTGCQKLEEKYKCLMGPLVDYLIELCKEVEEKYPQVFVSTLAYRKKQSEFPPVMDGKLPKNLIIEFAPIDDDFSKTFQHKNNAETYQNIKGWTKIAENVNLWYYPLPYGSDRRPFGGTERVAIDTRLLYEAGVRGAIYEHDVAVHNGLNFADIMTWVMVRLFIDPYQDYQSLVREFCEFYYGKAADDVIAYMNELDRYTREFPGFHIWNGGSLKTAMTPDNVARWEKLFDQMEAKTADDKFANGNVKDMRIALDLASLFQWQGINKKYPGTVAAPEEIEKRIRESYQASVFKRIPPEKHSARLHWMKKLPSLLELAMLYAKADPKPLPPPFDKLPAEKVRQVFPPKDKRKPDSVVVDPDAAFGYGVYYPKKPLEMPFTFGIYDNSAQKFVMSKTLTSDQIVPDKYHFYKVGDYAFSPNSLVWTKGSWGVCVNMSDFYIAGEDPEKKYEVWISIKFEGPGYSKGSKKDKDRALIDRVIAVEK